MKNLTGILAAGFLFTAAGAAWAQQKVGDRPWKAPKGGVAWEKSFEAAQKKAKKENKRFLRDAVELRNRLFDDAMKPRDGGLASARKLHEDRIRDMADGLEDCKDAEGAGGGWQGIFKNAKPFTYRGQVHIHNNSCVRAMREGYEYLLKLHRHWAEARELPDLESVRYTYLWGNPFTEESEKAARIADLPKDGPPPPPAPRRPRIARGKQGELEGKSGARLGLAAGTPGPLHLFGGP